MTDADIVNRIATLKEWLDTNVHFMEKDKFLQGQSTAIRAEITWLEGFLKNTG